MSNTTNHRSLSWVVVYILLAVVVIWSFAAESLLAEATPQAVTTLIAMADSRVSQGTPADNFGSDPQLLVGHASKAGLDLSLIRFDLQGLPPDIVITGATLRGYVLDFSGSTAVSVSVRRVTTTWVESAVSWNTRAGVNPQPLSTVDIADSGWATWDVTAQVQAWHRGQAPNYGLELGGRAPDDYAIYLSAREGSHPSELVVTYDIEPTATATATPTPTRTVAPKSDLVVADIWPAPNALCFQVRNVGGAPAPAGHLAGLWIDGGLVAQQVVPVSLRPGERYKGCFPDPPVCTSPQDLVRVCADTADATSEADETNNCREETWICDTTVPVILSGPEMSEITPDSASVSWTTNEASDSHGRRAGFLNQETVMFEMVIEHHVPLAGLTPSTLYQVEVISTDPAGNSTTSHPLFFSTLPKPDGQDPTVTIPDMEPLAGLVKLQPLVSDNIGVRAVTFYLDGERLGSDFSPPFELALDTTGHSNGLHTLAVEARDFSGRGKQDDIEIEFANRLPDLLPPQVWITNPEDGHTVTRGTVDVIAHAHDEDPNITGSGPVARVEFYIDGVHKATMTEADTPFTYSFPWNTMVAAEGERHVKAVAYDDAGNAAEHTIIAVVPELTAMPIEPILAVSRLPLERYGNWYRTGLRVENTGFKRVTMLSLVDRLIGFQARSSGDAPLSAVYTWHQRACDVTLGGHISLDPGEVEEITYRFIPVLYESDAAYQVGKSTTLSYLGPDGNGVQQRVDHTRDKRSGSGKSGGIGQLYHRHQPAPSVRLLRRDRRERPVELYGQTRCREARRSGLSLPRQRSHLEKPPARRRQVGQPAI